MLRILKNLLHRPAIRMGMARGRRGTLRDPRFVSFLAQNNHKQLDTNFHDMVLRGRRLVRHALLLLLAGGCAWVVIESARALTVF
ncbi:MAG: hypothetical protein ACHQ4G_03510 [Opitutales bacterium]